VTIYRDEQIARQAIVEYARLCWQRELVYGTSGNISVRLADGDILITPSSVSLRVLTPAEIVRLDPDGRRPRNPAQKPSSETPLHLYAYRTRDDVAAVIHTHPTYCVVWSIRGRLFPLDTVGAQESLGTIAWTAYAPPGSSELAHIVSGAFAAGNDTVLMGRHGLSSVGPSLEAAFVRSDLAEGTARIGILADK
jgi:L-fuculose-phosphate aldolase